MTTATASNRMLQAILLVGGGLVVTGLHFATGTENHQQHLVHIFLRTLCLLIILGSVLWFGIRGNVAAALGISVLYFVDIRVSWPDDPMENANQFTMLGVNVLFGGLGGWPLPDGPPACACGRYGGAGQKDHR
ncbi:MAG: hypothetical protein H3C63_07275 [Candidatus Omnitrophica bacterium]|nr:hypothetical protein [Candidatus Omnitrophota bacterium]MCG3144133.1 hypothetical protein [Gammaproteobacteria bacterium]